MSTLNSKRGVRQQQQRGPRGSSCCGGMFMLSIGLLMGGFAGFPIGFMMGNSSSFSSSSIMQSSSEEGTMEAQIRERVAREVQKLSLQDMKHGNDDTASRFPKTVGEFLTGMVAVSRDEFAEKFDTGVPLDKSSRRNSQVTIMYQTTDALPKDPYISKEAVSQTTIPVMSSVEDAVENCEFLNVILTHHTSRKQCVAMMGQYEAFHIQKFMRLPVDKGALDASLPLRLVNRGAQPSGRKSTKVPTLEETREYWNVLEQYLSNLDTVLEQLQPLAKQVATKSNTVVIMVCNFGQSELLMNFCCHARQRNLDLSHILLFATDEETRDLGRGLGLHVFYDEISYGDMPKRAASRYADKTFMKMMMAKVFCVQQMSILGYNVLFQDVDVIWYKDPLVYFEENTKYDIYFQDDGNHALYYAPYSANTGFYYVQSNERTRHFFNSFLMNGDLILTSHSHQVPLVALLQEHASMYGMRVKIWSRDENDFPGGHAFHRRNDFMKQIIRGEETPYIFHMSWTHNKDNKIKFYRQLGEWYLKDDCIQKEPEKILGHTVSSSESTELVQPCCATESIFSCHYRDKPSKHPCKDSPPIDEGRRSFW